MPEEFLNTTESFKPWTEQHAPQRILAIRLQAFGDTFIAISYLQSLRNILPKNTKLDIMVREEFKNIAINLDLFDNVYILKGGNRTRYQLLYLIPLLIKLKFRKYDVILDLQNNFISNIIRKFITPLCYTEFDRLSSQHAGIRTKQTINKANIGTITENYNYTFKNKQTAKHIIDKYNWKPGEKLIVLNPAGAFENRNWETNKYIELAKQLLKDYDSNLRFVVFGTYKISEKVKQLEDALGDKLINLIEETSQSEALALMQKIDLMISEDGALLHMAYLSQKNTIAIIGPTRSDWMNPKLPHTHFFTADNLECGNCMLEKCKLPRTLCMEQVTVQMVFDKAVEFLKATTNA